MTVGSAKFGLMAAAGAGGAFTAFGGIITQVAQRVAPNTTGI